MPRLNASSFVLDASALRALLNEEPENGRVEEAIGDSSINAVNYCEVIGRLILPSVYAKFQR